MSAPKAWVLSWFSDGGEMTLTGPFKSESTASAFGRAWQRENDDNPCWQVLTGQHPTLHRVSVPARFEGLAA